MLLENIHRELKTIQGVVDRMATNSFRFKSWAFFLTSFFVGLFSYWAYLAIPLVVMCWGYDAYFLRLERMYREMYYWVSKNRLDKKKEFLFDLNPYRFKKEVGGLFKIMVDRYLVLYYVILISVLILVIVI